MIPSPEEFAAEVGKYVRKGYAFQGEDYRLMLKPCIYLMVGKDDLPLYVGYSKNGANRPFRPDHHAKAARARCQQLLIYPCRSEADAKQLESYLIEHLRPTYNVRRNDSQLRKALGLAGNNSYIRHYRIAAGLPVRKVKEDSRGTPYRGLLPRRKANDADEQEGEPLLTVITP